MWSMLKPKKQRKCKVDRYDSNWHLAHTKCRTCPEDVERWTKNSNLHNTFGPLNPSYSREWQESLSGTIPSQLQWCCHILELVKNIKRIKNYIDQIPLIHDKNPFILWKSGTYSVCQTNFLKKNMLRNHINQCDFWYTWCSQTGSKIWLVSITEAAHKCP